MGVLTLLAVGACGDAPRSTPVNPVSGQSYVGAPDVPEAERVPARLVAALFALSRSDDVPSELKPFLTGERGASPADPNWPVLTYLVGEAQKARGQPERARATFRALVSWAATRPTGPYGDTWGGSGLVALGLWRWLLLLEPHAGAGTADIKAEVDQALDVAASLTETRLFSGMVRDTAPLPALPLLREDVARRLARIAWRGNRPQAPALFLEFLAIDSRGELDAVDQEILGKLQSRVDVERLRLFRARKLLDLVKTEARKAEAAATLEALWANPQAPADLRAEAGYEWANFHRRKVLLRSRLLEILTSTIELAQGHGSIAERALYLRALVHNVEPGPNVVAFRADMNEYLRRFPEGSLVDEALFQLATDTLFRLDTDDALAYFQRLRDLPDPNRYRDSAHFLPALALVGRNGPGDLAAADTLLNEYAQRYPSGLFRFRCLFWRGRIAEARGEERVATTLFRQVIEEAPYDYYGLRARMHLEDGRAAAGKDVPDAGSTVRRDLHRIYGQSRIDTNVVATSPYHGRVEAAARGLYGDLLKIESKLGERLDDLPLARVDERGLLPAVGLLLALRQDALAARDADPSIDNRLRLAAVLGREVGDWPVALMMTSVDDVRSGRLAKLQRDPRYLATTYSPVLSVLEPALGSAAWPIDGSRATSKSLMYAVMRQESGFYPKAMSRTGALGLFQFLPATFDSLDRRWGLRRSSGVDSSVEYLLDPERNAALWARWVKTEFKLTRRHEITTTVMKHHAGSILSSIEFWDRLGLAGDVEFRVETARFNATRNFVRHVLQDLIIVDAAGLFEDRSGG